MTEAPLCLAPTRPQNRSGVMLPEGTVDCHFHVFEPAAPLASPRSYTPQPETIGGWQRLATTFGIARGVLVQPSVYGLDNSVLLSALGREPERLRAVVVIAPDISSPDLERLHGLGVRGVRINLRNKGGIGLEAAGLLAPRLRDLGWHLQFQIGPDQIATVADLCDQHQIDGVIDHLAFMPLDAPDTHLAMLHAALGAERVWVKLSAPYRLSDQSGHAGYRAVVSSLCSQHPDCLLWGSDWPHTELFASMPEDQDLVALGLEAVPSALHKQVFVLNPQKLYWSN